MDRDLYPKRWGLGPRALRKKTLIKDGLLEKNGKPNAQTPQDWTVYYVNEENNNVPKVAAVQEEENWKIFLELFCLLITNFYVLFPLIIES